jgi:dethiobiotin synthase
MGKALGVQGGFAACSRTLRDWLWNRARSMVFSTGTSPVLSELARGQLRLLRGADAERERLKRVEARLVERLVSAGVAMTPGRHGPVIPVVLGSEAAVLEAARLAAERGVYCQPIRPPTVPAGKSRLRISLRADLADADIEVLANALVDVWERAQRERGPEPAGDISRDLEAARISTRAASQDGVHAVDTARGGMLRGGVLGSGGPVLSPREDADARENEKTPGGLAGVSTRSAGRLAEPPAAPLAPSERPWVVLGTGTGVGKTFVSRALVGALAASGRPVAGLKPIETGLRDALPRTSDAERLAAVSFHVKLPSPHPLYGYPDPVAPSRAARAAADTIDLARIAAWARTAATLDAAAPTGGAPALVVETAGGVFSPLSATATNLDLARELEPATWLLVAPDRLGVLHDVTSCLHAMSTLGRRPDWLILSAPADADPSTGTNAQELALLPGCPPIIELPRNDATPLLRLLSPLAHPNNA